MCSLRDFGGGINDAGSQSTPSRSTVFPRGRCEAVIGDGHQIRRCQNDAARGRDCCYQHNDKKNQVTIHSDPSALLRLGRQRSGSCRALKEDGKRCNNSTTATRILCGIHQDTQDPDIVQPTEKELNQELIHEALTSLDAAVN
jgi:hypothetical protein